jgi:hypothetical protein
MSNFVHITDSLGYQVYVNPRAITYLEPKTVPANRPRSSFTESRDYQLVICFGAGFKASLAELHFSSEDTRNVALQRITKHGKDQEHE